MRHLIESGVVPTARLTEIFRQAAESRIITSAHRINAGELPDLQPPETGETDFFFIERDEPERIAPRSRNSRATASRRNGASIPCATSRCFDAHEPRPRGGAGAERRSSRTALNPARPGEPAVEKFGWQFRPRDKVIQTQNNYDKEVYNGDLGFIERIDMEESEIAVRYETRQRRPTVSANWTNLRLPTRSRFTNRKAPSSGGDPAAGDESVHAVSNAICFTPASRAGDGWWCSSANAARWRGR